MVWYCDAKITQFVRSEKNVVVKISGARNRYGQFCFFPLGNLIKNNSSNYLN